MLPKYARQALPPPYPTKAFASGLAVSATPIQRMITNTGRVAWAEAIIVG